MKKTLFLLIMIVNLLLAQNLSEAKKQKQIYPTAQKILNYKCKDNTLSSKHYMNKENVKMSIQEQCEKLNNKELQALNIYLWDMNGMHNMKHMHHSIFKMGSSLNKKDKCPVCGMFVHKYPKWSTKITYMSKNKKKYYFFDGPKDMFKYLLALKKYKAPIDFRLKKVFVKDYYSQEMIDAEKAFYVLGSDVYGPMGKEIIPFKNNTDAKVFSNDHQGDIVLKYNEITKLIICKLDKSFCK